MRLAAAILVLMAGCGTDSVAPDASLDAPIDGPPADAAHLGDPCTPDFTEIVSPCSSTLWCSDIDGDGQYHCEPSCDGQLQCPSGWHRTPIQGNHCECEPP